MHYKLFGKHTGLRIFELALVGGPSLLKRIRRK